MTSILSLAAYIALLVLLVQPFGVPDPFGLGPDLAWTAVCFFLSLPVLAEIYADRRWPRTRFDLFILGYLAFVVLTWPTAYDRFQTLLWVSALAANLCLFVGTVRLVRRHPWVSSAILVVVIVGIGIVQITMLLFHMEQGLLTRPRAYPWWSGYPELGLLACVQFGMLLGLVQRRGRWVLRVALGVLIVVTAIELGFLYSRTAWISALGVLIVAAALAARRVGFRRVVPVVAAAALVVGLALSQNSTVRRLVAGTVGLNTGSAAGDVPLYIATPEMRLLIWKRTARMILDHPALGVGLGNFRAVYEPIYNPVPNNDGRRGVHAHNLWLHQMAELGIGGGVAYVVLWGGFLWLGWPRKPGSTVHLAIFLAIVAIAIRNLTDNMFFEVGDPGGRLYTLTWVCFGVIAGLSDRRSRVNGLAPPSVDRTGMPQQ